MTVSMTTHTDKLSNMELFNGCHGASIFALLRSEYSTLASNAFQMRIIAIISSVLYYKAISV
jgi:hypothetical protein